jgi:hypothetical protein
LAGQRRTAGLGVNDFDEAAAIPYPFDLMRLAASVRLADEPGVSNHGAAAAIAEGYTRGLAAPRPTLLDEQETWMRAYVGVSDKKREKFWKRLDDLPAIAAPAPVIAALQKSMLIARRFLKSRQCKKEWEASGIRVSLLWPCGATAK